MRDVREIKNTKDVTIGTGNDALTTYTFTQAMDLTGFGKYNLMLLGLVGLALLGVIMESACMSIVMPAAQCDLGLTATSKGMISTMYIFGLITSSHLWGFLGDIQGRRYMMIIPAICSFIATFIASFADNIWVFGVLRYVAGFFGGCPAGVVYAYFGEFHTEKRRAGAITWASSFVAMAVLLVPCLGWAVLLMDWSLVIPFLDVTYRPWRFLLLVYSFPLFLFAVFLYLLPESPRFLYENGHVEKALEILTKMYSVNKGEPADTFGVKSLVEPPPKPEKPQSSNPKSKLHFFQTIWNQTVPVFMPPFLSKILLLCTLQFGGFFASLGFYMWIPEILNTVSTLEPTNQTLTVCQMFSMSQAQKRSLDEIEVSGPECTVVIKQDMFMYTVALGIVVYICYVLAAAFISRLGKKNVLFGIFLFSGVTGCLVNFATAQWLIVILLCSFMVSTLTVGITNTFTADIFPTQFRALAISISFMIGRLGAVTGSNLASPLLNYDCPLAFYIFSGQLIVCAVLVLLLPKNTTDEPSKNNKESTNL